eukprot:TRINITY_DN18501_c0_g1_i1.p1 TRINITY_DN18501_c0_g1~~TRINITY_DN18501_c0_g1_i1.p1  ORF type:complete len:834 (+),score=177.86 TRINITY_DN18501_c0_g1_i1:208-2502(+)
MYVKSTASPSEKGQQKESSGKLTAPHPPPVLPSPSKTDHNTTGEAASVAGFTLPAPKVFSRSGRTVGRSYDPWPVRPVMRSRPIHAGIEMAWGAKPELLRQMESLIDAELSMLSQSESPRIKKGLWQEQSAVLDTARMRVFLSAFRMFISGSQVYGPVLEAVHNEIEGFVHTYDQLLAGAEATSRDTEAIRHFCDEQIGELQREHIRDKAIWDQEVEGLHQTLREKEEEVSKARAHHGELKRIEKLYADKWSEEREKVLTMISQIRDAEEQHQETMIQFEKLKRDTLGVQDLMKLYQKTADDLQQLKEDYSESVPRKDFDLLNRLLKEKNEKIVQMKITCAGLRKKNETSEGQVQKCQRIIEQLEADCKRLRDGKGRDTPRPDWTSLTQENDISLDLDCSTQHVAEQLTELLQKEKTRNQTLEKEIASIKERLSFLGDGDQENTTEESSELEYFVGLGTGREVPKYLRWFGQVKNRDLPKREVEHFIQDYWAARKKDNEKYAKIMEEDTKGKRNKNIPPQENMEEFMNTYLKAKHGMQARIVDKGYNIKYGCKKYSYDGDCELFLLILENHIPEVVYYEQMKMLDKLQKRLEELELPGPTGKRTGKVKKSKVLPMLDKMFPAKSEKSLIRLKYALSKQVTGDEVNIPALFAEDREGNQGPFLECVRGQMVKESLEYYQQVSNAIFLKADGVNADNQETVTIGKVREAILELDPQKPQKDVDRMICLGMGLADSPVIEDHVTVELEVFLTKMKLGYFHRHTKAQD